MLTAKKLLVTGSAGLIGSEVVDHFCARGWSVCGVDNNMRADFFGPEGDTTWNRRRLIEVHNGRYHHVPVDIRDRAALAQLVEEVQPAAVVHAAAQPSHDLAAARPLDDFDVNAVGTLNLLDSCRRFAPEAPFVHLSTNKVYGDRPNQIALREEATRWEYDDPAFADGIPEDFPIDQCKHSVFGASKTSADILVQEYARYYGMLGCCLRAGCLTGPNHSGVELHGFLSYLVKCNVEGRHYRIYGYKGKQVRDNIHAADVVGLIECFIEAPREGGQVYNLGGGRENSVSILEAFERVAALSGKPMQHSYEEKNREGDHICYISNLAKIRADFPQWQLTKSLDSIFEELYASWRVRLASADSPR